MARNGLVFALVAAVAVICFLAFSGQQQVASPVARAAGGIARPVFVRAANNIKMPQSALGSWGDAIKKNALGAGVVPNKKPITKKAW